MFQWYREAHICYAFLSDVPANDDPRDSMSRFFSSLCFRRGWTLQELLAPPNVRFYSSDWRYLGTKGSLCDAVEKITGIPTQFLLGITELHHASVAKRMSWASRRATKRKEDLAYCLLGIFSVNMPMIYGEGDEAFRRLQEQIMKDIRDDSILAWDLDLKELTHDGSFEFISGGVLAAAPADFANCGQIASRERYPRHIFDISGGSLRLQLPIFTTPACGTLGLLSCGPEHDLDRLVGIPLATTSRGLPCEYMRIKGRNVSLVPRPMTQVDTQLVQIRIDGECEPAAAPGQRYWFRVQESISDIELIDVKPQLRWHRERALIEGIISPDSGGVQRTLTRFRHKMDEYIDFMVMLEVEVQCSELQARCHVMIGSRHTSLRDVIRKFTSMRPETFGKQGASNGIVNLCVTLEHVATQRLFIMRLDTLFSLPSSSVNVNSELQYLGLMMEIECIEQVEEKIVLEREESSQKVEEKTSILGQMKKELEGVRKELKKLREKESLLANGIENRAQEISLLNAADEEIRTKKENMLSRRLEAQRRFNELQNYKPTTREDIEELMAEDSQTLHWAAENGHEAVVRILLDRVADTAATGSDSWTLLHSAALNRNGAITQILLDRGAGMTAREKFGETPLHIAAIHSNEVVTQLLLDRGADIATEDYRGWTPLHTAARHGNESVIRVFLDRGADVAAEDCAGWTPLHFAVRRGNEGIIRTLLDNGADIAVKEHHGWTPLHIAAQYGREVTVRLLLNKGADIDAVDWEALVIAGSCPTEQT